MNSRNPDWHPADIIAALRKQGTTLAAVSRKAGLSSSTLANALSRRGVADRRSDRHPPFGDLAKPLLRSAQRLPAGSQGTHQIVNAGKNRRNSVRRRLSADYRQRSVIDELLAQLDIFVQHVQHLVQRFLLEGAQGADIFALFNAVLPSTSGCAKKRAYLPSPST